MNVEKINLSHAKHLKLNAKDLKIMAVHYVKPYFPEHWPVNK